MKKLVLTLGLLLSLVSYQANGQAMNIGAHLSSALPVGDFADASSFGFGGGITADYYFNDHFNLGVELEYLSFAQKNTDFTNGFIPVLLTGAYHTDFGDAVDFYAGLGAGAFLVNSNAPNAELVTEFGISPRIGIAFELDRRLFFDVSLRYGVLFDAQAEETRTSNGQTFTQPAVGNTMFVGLNLGILYTIYE